MATQESMMMRCNAALDSIEASVSALIGADVDTLPRLHRDKDMLRVMQLETIAKWLKELQEAELEAMPEKDAKAMFEASMAKADFPNQSKPRK